MVLQKVGYDVTRFPPPRVTPEGDIERLLRGARDEVVFDVGANIGETAAAYRAMLPTSTIHCFEPSPGTFRELTANVSGKVHLVNAAVGAAPGQLALQENEGSVMSSLLPLGPDGWGRVTKVTEVPVVTIDGYCDEHRVDRIDLLKTDTQGYDLEVLRGARRMLQTASVALVLTEMNFATLYDGQARADEIFGYMFDLGYVLVSLYDMHYLGDRAGWCDALFSAPAASAMSDTPDAIER